jgi:hypothetical protein
LQRGLLLWVPVPLLLLPLLVPRGCGLLGGGLLLLLLLPLPRPPAAAAAAGGGDTGVLLMGCGSGREHR